MKLQLNDITEHCSFALRANDYLRWYPKSLSKYTPNLFDHSIFLLNGIYIHVPFCDKICKFCPFNKVQSKDDQIELFVDSLIKEIDMYAEFVSNSKIEFIYFGGGTPSVLTREQLQKIFNKVYKTFSISNNIEVTLESHPSHLTTKYLKEIKETAVNRISSGIQSFTDITLKKIGAQHDSNTSYRAVQNTTDVFGNIAIDLLYRCPSQTLKTWETELETALKVGNVSHVSCYSLVLKNEKSQPDLQSDAQMGILAHDFLEGNSFKHYASCASGGFDFAKPENICKYELLHWNAPQAHFLGLGPGAFGYIGNFVTVNTLSNENYFKIIKSGSLPIISSKLTSNEELQHKYFAVGVKTLTVSLTEFESIFNVSASVNFKKQFEELQKNKWGYIEDHKLKITKLGAFFMDNISTMFYSLQEASVPHPEEPEIRKFELQYDRSYNA